MKSLPKLLIAGILVAAGILAALLWQRPPQPMSPVAAGAIARPATAAPATSSDSRTVASEAADSQAPLSADTMAVIHSILQKWLDAKRHGSEEKEAEECQTLVALLTMENAAQVTRSLTRDELQTPFGIEAIHTWTKASPTQASNWMASGPGFTQDEAWAVAQGWVVDAEGLHDYAIHLVPSSWKQALLQEAGGRMSKSDPVGAIALAQQMSPGDLQTSLLQSVATNWIATDPEADLAWINSIPDPSLHESLIAAAAKSYALTDPSAAAAWLSSAVKSGDIAKDAALNITQTWVVQDPAAAAQWVSQFPEGDARTAGIEIVSEYWMQTDPGNATSWVKSLGGNH